MSTKPQLRTKPGARTATQSTAAPPLGVAARTTTSRKVVIPPENTASSRPLRAAASTSPSTTPRPVKARTAACASPAPAEVAAVHSETTPRRTPRRKSASPSTSTKDTTAPYVPKDDILDTALRAAQAAGGVRSSAMLYRELVLNTQGKGAMFNLGWMYHFGVGGCDHNDKIAWSYFHAAADLGHPLASYYCGVLKEHGYGGQTVSLEGAMEYYITAAEGGCEIGSSAAARCERQQASLSGHPIAA